MANNRTPERERRRELLFKEPGQEYAQVIRVLGDKRMGLRCFDNVERVGHIRGSLRVWINLSDIVLVSLRDFDPGRIQSINIPLKRLVAFRPQASCLLVLTLTQLQLIWKGMEKMKNLELLSKTFNIYTRMYTFYADKRALILFIILIEIFTSY